MPSLIDLRRRVRAVKNTQQITKAMKMVAASKLRRATERITNARPYAVQMQRVLGGLASRVDPSIHPLLTTRERREDSRTLVIVVTGDKGLCGSFNTNAIKAGATYVVESGEKCALGLVGRKAREFFRRRSLEIVYDQAGVFQKLSFANAVELADIAIEEFTSGRASSVDILYNEFKSVMSQKVTMERLLPITRAEIEDPAAPVSSKPGGSGPQAEGGIDYVYEPQPEEIFRELLPRYVQVQIYRALLESNAAFFAAQMTAMDAATRNSTEMIDSLTLYMNKVRQAAITREIIEVVSGASAT